MTRMNWEKLVSKGRFRPSEDLLGGRSEYQRDVDKITFSSSFRRLQRKTQVHPQPSNDHVHTRLTHSLEVSSVGRTLGTLIGEFVKSELPESVIPFDIGTIVQASCLLHDIGNPPFGHAGEDAISEWFRLNIDRNHPLYSFRDEFEHFEGNAQGLRIATRTEYAQEYGMNLTYAVLASFIKYPRNIKSALASDSSKYGYFSSEKERFKSICSETGLIRMGNEFCRHPLAYAVEAADDICYAIVDLEDGFELKIVSFDEINEALTPCLNDEQKDKAREIQKRSTRQALKFLRGVAVEALIGSALEVFKENYQKIMSGEFTESIVSKDAEGALEAISNAKTIARDKIFNETRKIQLEIGSYACVAHLLKAFSKCVQEVYDTTQNREMSFQSSRLCDLLGANSPRNSKDKDESEQDAFRRIVDHVSGMTDDYAIFLSNQISGNVH